MGEYKHAQSPAPTGKKLPRRTGAGGSAGSFSPRQPGLACWLARRSARRPLRQQPRAPAPCLRSPTPSRTPARATTRYAGPPAIRTRTWHARLARADNHPGRHGDSARFIPLTEKIRPVIGGVTYACGVRLRPSRHTMNGSPPGAPVRNRTKTSWPDCSASSEDRVESGRRGLIPPAHARPSRDAP